MNKEIFEMKYIKEFILEIVDPSIRKSRKITINKINPPMITRIKEEGKRSCIIEINYNNRNTISEMLNSIEFKVTEKYFRGKDYDFSGQWRDFQNSKENVQTI